MARRPTESVNTIEPLLFRGGCDGATNAKPFLRWAGGKSRLVAQICEHFPRDFKYRRYVEPFVGGGALFFALNPRRAVLSDSNKDLINAYRQVKDNVEAIIRVLRGFKWTDNEYYEMRARRPRTTLNRAIRFIYLNRACWNGLYRENNRGDFNVPFGRYYRPSEIDDENLRRASCMLAGARLSACDYTKTLAKVREGDLVYIDPPYVVDGKNNGFIHYNADVFSWKQQQELARLASELVKRGAFVLVSNGADGQITRLYRKWGFERFPVRRKMTLAADSSKRGDYEESLFVSLLRR